MELALFDLDNTLLSGDSDYEWGQFLIGEGVLEREIYESENQRFYDDYKAGRLDIHEFLGFALAPLARHPREQLETWHARFMQARIRPIIRARGRACLAEHAAQGSLCAIITSTNSFVTAPIARELGVQHLIATEPEVGADGRFTGKPRGVPCFREGKIACLEAWLQAQGRRWQEFSAAWFYSDSHNDIPLLERVTNPVAVDPDPTLERLARERGWRITSFA